MARESLVTEQAQQGHMAQWAQSQVTEGQHRAAAAEEQAKHNAGMSAAYEAKVRQMEKEVEKLTAQVKAAERARSTALKQAAVAKNAVTEMQ